MSNKNLDNEYKKINSRLVRMYEKYGEDFGLYQQEAAVIRLNFETYVNPNGVIQIKRGKANANLNTFQMNSLDYVSKMGSLKTERETARKYLHDQGEKATPQRIEDIIKKRDYVRSNKNMISDISSQLDTGKTIADSLRQLYNKAAGRSEELTYDELFELMKKAEPDYNKMTKTKTKGRKKI